MNRPWPSREEAAEHLRGEGGTARGRFSKLDDAYSLYLCLHLSRHMPVPMPIPTRTAIAIACITYTYTYTYTYTNTFTYVYTCKFDREDWAQSLGALSFERPGVG